MMFTEMTPYTYTIRTSIDKQTYIQRLQTAPPIMQQSCCNWIMQLANDPRACELSISWEVDFWSKIDQEWQKRELFMEYKNHACSEGEVG